MLLHLLYQGLNVSVNPQIKAQSEQEKGRREARMFRFCLFFLKKGQFCCVSVGFTWADTETHWHTVINNVAPTGWQLILVWVIVFFIRSDGGSPAGIQQHGITMKLKYKLLNRWTNLSLSLSLCLILLHISLELIYWWMKGLDLTQPSIQDPNPHQ